MNLDKLPTVVDPREMERVGGALGSNPAGIYQDDAGRRYYVKTLESPELARNEWIAAQLYRLAGAPTLHYLPTRSPHQVATVWQDLDKSRLAQFDASECRQAQQVFGVHAWTANWDAVGFQGDNQGVAAGRVLTLDVGGALAYRAQGDPKGHAFGPVVDEIDRLRRDPDNPHARRLFGAMDAAALRAALEQVTRLPDAHVRDCVLSHGGGPALADKMLARKADMARRLAGLEAASAALHAPPR